MELVGIGEAARRVGVNASALRYYEERGLVAPAARRGGQRMYGPEELRKLMFVQLMRHLGVSLDAARSVLHDSGEQWREAMGETVTALEDLIARAESARYFLRHAAQCPAEHPVAECPFVIGMLDRTLDGVSFAELAAEYGHEAPPPDAGPPGRTPRTVRRPGGADADRGGGRTRKAGGARELSP